jgi:hypothetical protein
MSYLRTFVLLSDEAGDTETGKMVGVGAVMPSGHVVLEWATGTHGIVVFHSVDALLAAQNGHGRFAIRWGTWDEDD